MMRRSRWVPLGCLSFSACLLLAASLPGRSPDSYLFPRWLAVVMCGLAVLMLVDKTSRSHERTVARTAGTRAGIGPGLGLMLLYLAVAERLGFYLASGAFLVVLTSVYAPGEKRAGAFGRSLLVSLVCMAVMYLLFTTLLRVQLPHGIGF